MLFLFPTVLATSNLYYSSGLHFILCAKTTYTGACIFLCMYVCGVCMYYCSLRYFCCFNFITVISCSWWISYMFPFSLVFSIQWAFSNKISCVSCFQVLDFMRRYIGSATPLIAGNSVYMDLLFLKVSKTKDQLPSSWIWNDPIWFYLSHYSLGACISLDFYSAFGKPVLIVLVIPEVR